MHLQEHGSHHRWTSEEIVRLGRLNAPVPFPHSHAEVTKPNRTVEPTSVGLMR